MADELLDQCMTARTAGLDFPTVWQTIARVHPLVAGAPIQMADSGQVWLEVPLTTGERLKYDHTDGYSLIRAIEVAMRPR